MQFICVGHLIAQITWPPLKGGKTFNAWTRWSTFVSPKLKPMVPTWLVENTSTMVAWTREVGCTKNLIPVKVTHPKGTLPMCWRSRCTLTRRQKFGHPPHKNVPRRTSIGNRIVKYMDIKSWGGGLHHLSIPKLKINFDSRDLTILVMTICSCRPQIFVFFLSSWWHVIII